MGDAADALLDGTMCERCGEYIDDGEDPPGYPRLCGGCAQEVSQDRKVRPKGKRDAHKSHNMKGKVDGRR